MQYYISVFVYYYIILSSSWQKELDKIALEQTCSTQNTHFLKVIHVFLKQLPPGLTSSCQCHPQWTHLCTIQHINTTASVFFLQTVATVTQWGLTRALFCPQSAFYQFE